MPNERDQAREANPEYYSSLLLVWTLRSYNKPMNDRAKTIRVVLHPAQYAELDGRRPYRRLEFRTSPSQVMLCPMRLTLAVEKATIPVIPLSVPFHDRNQV